MVEKIDPKLLQYCLGFWRFSNAMKGGHFGPLLGLRPKQLGGELEILELNSKRSVVAAKAPSWFVCFNFFLFGLF